MIRSAIIPAMVLVSIATASAQEPAGGKESQRPEQQTCVFAGESYSEGAEFCVTDHAGLRCENGKWSRDTQLDCAGENMMRQGGGDGHMMPDHMMPHQ